MTFLWGTPEEPEGHPDLPYCPFCGARLHDDGRVACRKRVDTLCDWCHLHTDLFHQFVHIASGQMYCTDCVGEHGMAIAGAVTDEEGDENE